METSPPALETESPLESTRLPAAPLVVGPVDTVTEPLLPKPVDAEELMETNPLLLSTLLPLLICTLPPMPSVAEPPVRVIAPPTLESPIPEESPPRTFTLPPIPSSRLTVLLPAVRSMDPPSIFFPDVLPALIWTSPPSASVDAPDSSIISPDTPTALPVDKWSSPDTLSDTPVLSTTEPLFPFEPDFSVVMETEPLVSDVEYPL